MAVQFTYLQQNPDGSVTTQGVTAERAPTWGELHEHVASTGATLLPATPATQPPPATREAAPAAAPPPAPPGAPPPLPSAVEPTSGTAPTPVNPPRSLGSYVLPASAAAGGAYALPAIGGALLGPPGFLGGLGLATLGATYGGAGGEYAQAQLERKMYGEPPPGSPTPWERAKEFGTTAGETELAVQTASPLVMPLVRAVARPFGSTAVRSAAEAGPLLRTGAAGGERAAVEGGQSVARTVAHAPERGLTVQSIRAAKAAPTVPVNTDALVPHVAATRSALEAQGATAQELALFDRNMAPLAQGGPQPLHAVLGAERNLNRWTANMPGNLVLPELDALTTSTRNTIGTAVEGTPAAQPFQLYRQTRAVVAPTQAALREAGTTAPEGFQPFLAGPKGAEVLPNIAALGTPAEVAQVGQAWLASTRQAARTAADPVKYVADAYAALPVPIRTALFGEQTPALASLIGTASGGGAQGIRLPMVGTVPVAGPWARSVLLSPKAAALTNLAGKAASGGRTVLYTGAAQATEAKPRGAAAGP